MTLPTPAVLSGLMREALAQARSAAASGEVPVGAVVADGERIVAAAGNRVVTDRDPTAHAELLALRGAAAAVGNERLEGMLLVTTLEPCPMCLGAAIQARVAGIVFGAADPKGGAAGSRIDLLAVAGWNHYPECIGGILAGECGSLLTGFFREKRRDGRAAEGG